MVTYLFGAGASRNSVPILNELIGSMQREKNDLKENFTPKEEYIKINGNEYDAKGIFKQLIEDFEWVINDGAMHQSIDTFAKKLFIIGDFSNLKKLKIVISIYFLIIQSRNRVDIRYDSFFASILNTNRGDLPPNLRILTWNYDYQFEKSFAEYYRDYRIEACQTMLNIYSKNSRAPSFNSKKFGIVKLNGTASLVLDHDKGYPYNIITSVNQEYDYDLINSLLRNYALMVHVNSTKNKLNSSISFAWEDYDYGMAAIKNAIAATQETEILVVIGYSFPFFNRLVDRDIIRAMKGLKKVYFQAPDAEDLKERFLAVRDDLDNRNLLLRKDVKQFVFPNEF